MKEQIYAEAIGEWHATVKAQDLEIARLREQVAFICRTLSPTNHHHHHHHQGHQMNTMKRKGRLLRSSKNNDTIITRRFDRWHQDYVWTVFSGAYEEDGRTVYKRSAQFQTWIYGAKRAERLADRLHYRLTFRQMPWYEAHFYHGVI